MFTVENQEDKLIVKPQGPITISNNADEFREALGKYVQEGNVNIVIDLENVDMIDSKGLAVFVVCHQAVSEKGGSLTVVTDNEDLRTLFHVLRLDQHFTVCSPQEAYV